MHYWKEEHDPLKMARAELLSRGEMPESLDALEAEVDAQIEEWIVFAKESPAPHQSKATANVYVGWEVAGR